MSIAVTGATGQLGRIIVNKLKGSNSVIALVRDTAKAADLEVEARAFDYSKPNLLASALEGVETLVLVSGNEVGHRLAQHQNVIEAAKEAGVKRIIYTSLLRADSTLLDLGPEHAATEVAIKESGLAFTILRNGWYTENYTASIPGALKGGAFLGSAGNGRISSASREDYADAAVAVATQPGHEGKVYELAGDTSYTLADLAAELSLQSGLDIPYKDLPSAEYASALESFGLPKPIADMFAGFDASAAKGALYHDGKELSTLIGHPTTPLSATIAETLKHLG